MRLAIGSLVRQMLIAGCIFLWGCLNSDDQCPSVLFGGPRQGDSCAASQVGKCSNGNCICAKTDSGAPEYVCNYPPDMATIPDLGIRVDLRSLNDLAPPT